MSPPADRVADSAAIDFAGKEACKVPPAASKPALLERRYV